MPEAGANFSVYFNAELLEKFAVVQAHLGKGVSQSLAHLVEAKFLEIDTGETRREQIKLLRGDMQNMRAKLEVELDRILEILEAERHEQT